MKTGKRVAEKAKTRGNPELGSGCRGFRNWVAGVEGSELDECDDSYS